MKKTAYWNHTPLLLVTPQAANKTIGQGGFQEVEQMKLFEDMVAYQERGARPLPRGRGAEPRDPAGQAPSAPAQINMPRDFWTQVIDIDLPEIIEFERPSGGDGAMDEAAKLLSEARFPVILNGAGVVIGGAIEASKALAERLDAPVCVGYQHKRRLPRLAPALRGAPWATTARRRRWNSSRKPTWCSASARALNPFSTLPGYGIDYWPKDARIIQVEHQTPTASG